MSLLGFIVLLIVAGISGALGQALAGYSRGGCAVSIAVGFVGAFIGLWLARQFALPPLFALEIEGQPFPVFWAIVGSALFAALVGFINRRRRPLL